MAIEYLTPIHRPDDPSVSIATEMQHHSHREDRSNLSQLLRHVSHKHSAVSRDDPHQCDVSTRTCATSSKPHGDNVPFLSVITRTQGKRLQALTEVLMCLAGQSSSKFEHLIIGHNLSISQRLQIEQLIAQFPESVQQQTRLVLATGGTRSHPLNVGFQAARGDYIAILDDDDLPFAHWVETFQHLATLHSGRILRACCVRQNVDQVVVNQKSAVRSTGPMERPYPQDFDHIAHLTENYTPNMSLAFPRHVFHSLGVQFNENLTTAEDWEFTMRAANLVGVSCSAEITSVYRWWETGESSRTLHASEEWVKNRQAILRRFDESPLLLSPGATAQIRLLFELVQLPEKTIHFLVQIHKLHRKYQQLIVPLKFLRGLLPRMRISPVASCFRFAYGRLGKLLRVWNRSDRKKPAKA